MFHGLLSNSELLLMKYLWAAQENGEIGKPFFEIVNHANGDLAKSWKKQTINTFLTRLKEKGVISSTPRKGKAIYSPIITREEYCRDIIRQIAPEPFDFPTGMMDALLGIRKLSPQEKLQLMEYIEAL